MKYTPLQISIVEDGKEKKKKKEACHAANSFCLVRMCACANWFESSYK